MFKFLGNLFSGGESKTTVVSGQNRVRSQYDAAQTTDANSGHWNNADGFSARLANAPAVRKVLRERARYEWANNCYAKGMIATDADYVIGTGPRLQVLTEDDEYNAEVERKFHEWATKVKFGRKLWTMRTAWRRDGESFALFRKNNRLHHPVKLDLKLIECDQVADDFSSFDLNVKNDDGIILDDDGNPLAYKIWPQHPGDLFGVTIKGVNKPSLIPAEDAIHLFRRDRPGQYRGVSEIAPALMLYPTMRRWTYAALGSAEKAARISGVIKSTYSPDEPAAIAAMEDIYLEADSFLTLPEGWDISQIRAEQPSTQYGMFKRAVISEMSRCLSQPYNIAAADSSEYNFASGKLDHLGWYKFVGIDEASVGDDACTPTFEKWFIYAQGLDGYLPPKPTDFEFPPHVWFWDGQDTIDPREANATDTSLKNGSQTLPRVWAKKGLDAKQELTAYSKALGMSYEELQEKLRENLFSNSQPLETNEATNEQQEQEENEASAKSNRSKFTGSREAIGVDGFSRN